tara:strand:- start:157 stop:369 length:213 start_codon:yes stop_codon:yes gene_type:complete
MGIHRTQKNIGDYFNNLGRYYLEKGNSDKAIEYYNKVIYSKKELYIGWISTAFKNRGDAKRNLGNMSGLL